ncbi:MAG: 7,8-didemethyl-8-hydroxy-5-deazariboflavin synthase CofG [Candidatus Bathyarchaeota archaeon]|nr:7,8-didemethyl-8-hydroxy-5-deazariboflavin synthase CofG [Candidatus Bathyarchaeota archaeon]
MSKLSPQIEAVLLSAIDGKAVTPEDAHILIKSDDAELRALMNVACLIRDCEKGQIISYSKKVFIPLTNICRNNCGYCGFRREPSDPSARIMTPTEVLEIAEAGKNAGCKEALFALGEKPEELYPEVRKKLNSAGYESMVEYLHEMCDLVVKKTGLLPHSNAGVMNRSELAKLRENNASMGLMLENVSERLCEPGEPHNLSPGKHPALRIATIEDAGQLKIPFTTGLLIGIGETLEERVNSLFAIKRINEKYGHIQEVIIQNFQAKPKTPMKQFLEPAVLDVIRTVAVARLIFRGEPNIQVPPNLSRGVYTRFLFAGINDWGGISPVTKDFINPEAPWPRIKKLEEKTVKAGFKLKERLSIYPEYITKKRGFMSNSLEDQMKALVDECGYVAKGGL